MSMATPSEGVVGAIVPSDFARENPVYTNGSFPFYWKEETRKKKSGRQAVCSSDGRIHHVTKGKEVCHYRCRHRTLCKGTLIVDPKKNGKVVNHVKHCCLPDQDVIRRGQEILGSQARPCPFRSADRFQFGERTSEELGYAPFYMEQPCSFPGETDLSIQQSNPPAVEGNLLQSLFTGDILHPEHNSGLYLQQMLSESLTISPNILRVREGCNAILTCTNDNGSYPTECITWSGPLGIIGQDQSDRVYSMGNLLFIREVKHNDGGSYQCKGMTTGIKSSVAVMEVNRPPTILNPESVQQIHLQQTAFIDCDIDRGFPTSTVTWSKNNTLINDARITVMNDGLQIRDVQQSDEGVYTCCARNIEGSASLMIAVRVCYNGSSNEGSQPKITRNPQDQLGVFPGSQVQFSAEATGDNVKYQWKHNGEDTTDENGRITGSKTQVLTIFSAEEKDEGTYECVAFNEHGNAFSTPALLELIKEQEICRPQLTLLQSSGPAYDLDTCSYMWHDEYFSQFGEEIAQSGTEFCQIHNNSSKCVVATEHFEDSTKDITPTESLAIQLHKLKVKKDPCEKIGQSEKDVTDTDLAKMSTSHTEHETHSDLSSEQGCSTACFDNLGTKKDVNLRKATILTKGKQSSNYKHHSVNGNEQDTGTRIQTSTTTDIVPTQESDSSVNSELVFAFQHTNIVKPVMEATDAGESSKLVIARSYHRLKHSFNTLHLNCHNRQNREGEELLWSQRGVSVGFYGKM